MQVVTAEQAGRPSSAREASMPPPLTAARFDLTDPRVGRIACYGETHDGTTQPPLLLIHSVNAAATAYEAKPLFEHYRSRRTVYALDLPGFGLSDRTERVYTPRLMTDAVLLTLREIRKRHGDARVDVVALSLSCEFAA